MVRSVRVVACLAFGISTQVFAAGFQLQEQNVTNLGTAYSGTAALAQDASMAFFNAAGLSHIDESQVVLSGVLIQGHFHFLASRSNVSLLPNTIVAGDRDDDPARAVVAPAFYIAKRLDEHWVLGLSVNSPFGLLTDYNPMGIARYIGTYSSIMTVNISPSLSYEVLPCLSLGFGVDAEYGKASYEANVGFGIAALDGFQKNMGTGWGYGWHAGILWEPFEPDTTRIGLHYRSHVMMEFEGVAGVLVAGTVPGPYLMQRVHTAIVLPGSATFSFYRELVPCLAMTGDIAWTNWHRFDALTFSYNPGISPGIDTDIVADWKDSWRYALGLIYTLNENWLFRIGGAFDQSPTNDAHRTIQIPDSDRYWAAIGGAYTFNEDFRIDFGYARIFFEDTAVNQIAPYRTNTTTPASYAAIVGGFKNFANIVGIQIRYDFV